MIIFSRKLTGDMVKYKLIKNLPYPYERLVVGEIYNEDNKSVGLSIRELSILYPGYFKKIKNDIRANYHWQYHMYKSTFHPYRDDCLTTLGHAMHSKILGEDNFKLPKKWYIEVTHENSDIIAKWREKEGFFIHPRVSGGYMNEEGFLSTYPPTGTRISFNEFKKYVLGMENKKIIGYKLIRPEYYKAASTILFGNNAGDYFLDSYIPIKSDSIDILIKADVLDLWFEPVYEEEFKIGDWVVVLPEDEFYHNSDKGKAQKIYDIRESASLPYKLKLSDGSTNAYKKIRKATPDEIKAAQRNKLPVINGYEGKIIKKAGYGDGILEYGCARIPTKLINDIYDIDTHRKLNIDFNRKVASITLDSGVTITWEHIQQIVEYLNSK